MTDEKPHVKADPTEPSYSGLRIETELVDYYFPFIEDPRVITHPAADQLLALAGPDITINAVNRVMNELEIQDKLNIARLVPDETQRWRIHSSTGLACRTPTKESMELMLDLDNPNTMESLARWGTRQIAHELDHVKRLQNHELHTTLADALISEGLAVYYEEHFGGIFDESHWGHVLTPEELLSEWGKAKIELESQAYNFGDWFYGNQGSHKMYTGYSLGNAILDSYFSRNPDVTILQATQMDSRTILLESGYL